MKESFWGIFVIFLGVTSLMFIVLFQSLTNVDQHNTLLLNEVTEAAMWDAYDWGYYRQTGKDRIDREKFVTIFVRRFADSANMSRDYKLIFYDISEDPPKVSVGVKSTQIGVNNDTAVTFSIYNNIDAILEKPY